MNKTIEILKALSDENRFRIVMMLKVKAMCVCEISEILSIANSTLSAHLKTLKLVGVIDQKKDGRWIEYFIKDEKKIIILINNIEESLSDKKQIIQDREAAKTITRDVCTKNNMK